MAEATGTKLKYAGFLVRLGAYVIDAIVVGVVSFVASVVFGMALKETGAMLGMLVGILFALYNYVYLVGTKGYTIGKNVLKLKVVRTDGSCPIGLGRAVLREIVGKIISSVVIYLGFIWIAIDEKKQGWHDKIADTLVVYQ